MRRGRSNNNDAALVAGFLRRRLFGWRSGSGWEFLLLGPASCQGRRGRQSIGLGRCAERTQSCVFIVGVRRRLGATVRRLSQSAHLESSLVSTYSSLLARFGRDTVRLIANPNKVRPLHTTLHVTAFTRVPTLYASQLRSLHHQAQL